MSTIRVNGKDEPLAVPTVAELLAGRGIVRPRGRRGRAQRRGGAGGIVARDARSRVAT